MRRKLIVLGTAIVLLFGTALFLKSGENGAGFLWNLSDEGKWLLPLVGVSALIDSINPCAFSVLLLTVAFLFSAGAMRSNILKIGGLYVLGVFTVYILIGLGIIQTLHIFNTPHFMAKIGASLLIVLGIINLIGEFFPSFPIKLRIPGIAHRKIAQLMGQASFGAAFLLGALVGLCEFPCTGGPYLMVLGLLHDKATYLSGLGYLILYNLIFILPLVVILLAAGNVGLLEKIREWKKSENRNMRVFGGVAMVGLGIIIFFL